MPLHGWNQLNDKYFNHKTISAYNLLWKIFNLGNEFNFFNKISHRHAKLRNHKREMARKVVATLLHNSTHNLNCWTRILDLGDPNLSFCLLSLGSLSQGIGCYFMTSFYIFWIWRQITGVELGHTRQVCNLYCHLTNDLKWKKSTVHAELTAKYQSFIWNTLLI